MAGIYDLTGQNIENTYQRVLQTPDGVNVYDGTGSLFYLGTYNTATGSYGSFYDTGSYTPASATAIYSMSLSTTDISNGVYVSGSDRTRIYVTNAGVYNFQFSAQFSNIDNVGTDISIWLRKNDGSSADDIVDTNSIITVPPRKGSTNGQTIAAWNFFLTLAANDFVSGDYGRVSVTAWAYDTAGNTGVSFWLNNIQLLEKGESLGGKSSAADDFGIAKPAVTNDPF